MALVGECTGRMAFHDSFTEEQPVRLSRRPRLDARGCVGPSIPRGFPTTSAVRSNLYFWDQRQAGGRKVPPPVQDASLVDALRTLRPQGAVRFVVTIGGLVLTKVPVGNWKNLEWEPRFVGRIDFRRWYAKEV